jgi:tetratricopeptide (TPR) repeat protein
MQQSYRYKAFISYSHRDEKWASWLHRAIETYRVPKYLVGQQTPMGTIPARTSPVFRDRDELASATDLGTKLREALEGSACLLVICSPASAASHWVNEEILSFKRLGRADRIFALIVGGEPYASGMPGREQEECFPPALRFLLDDDGNLSTRPAEPIAADAREGKDGKSNAQIKLLAGMLGVGFDALRQREQQRRQRRLAIIAAGSTAGMVLAIGLATLAVIARNEAEVQRARAQKEAETARKVSSFMVGLFKVADPSEARGKSITAREILTAGAGRIDTELKGEPAVQAELMDTIGTVYAGLGLYTDASGMLRRSLAKRSTIENVAPEAIARNQVQLADVLTAQAELKNAEQLYLDAIATLDGGSGPGTGVEQAPASHQTLEQLSGALAGLAEVYYQAGRYTDAEPILARVLELRRRFLPDGAPGIADAIEELGLNQWDQGNLEQSEKLLRESLEMRRTSLGDEPHPAMASHLNNLALLLMDLKQFSESEKLFREAMQMNNALYGETHPDIATGLNNLGLMYRAEGELAKAEESYRQALEMQRTLLGPEHPTVARSLNNLAFVLYDEGEVDAAIEAQREATELRRKALGDKHEDTANSIAALARWLAVRGPSAEAEKLARDALALQIELNGAEHEEVGKAEIGLAHALKWKADKREALDSAQMATTRLRQLLGDSDWLIAYAVSTEGSVLAEMGRFDEAEPLLKSGYETLAGTPGAGRAYVWLAREALIALYERQGRAELALALRADGTQAMPATP